MRTFTITITTCDNWDINPTPEQQHHNNETNKSALQLLKDIFTLCNTYGLTGYQEPEDDQLPIETLTIGENSSGILPLSEIQRPIHIE